jgi:hypothetical protein
MAKSPKTKRKKPPKTVLKLPDLEQSKSAVLSSLASASSQRSYGARALPSSDRKEAWRGARGLLASTCVRF